MRSADRGEFHAQEVLFAELYGQLNAMAKQVLRGNGGGLTLGARTLLHETYLKLSKREGLEFPDHARFLAYAARAMRGLVIDYARRRRLPARSTSNGSAAPSTRSPRSPRTWRNWSISSISAATPSPISLPCAAFRNVP
jgi:DNA-directed RNA polymerase specialized sigma24 family protein